MDYITNRKMFKEQEGKKKETVTPPSRSSVRFRKQSKRSRNNDRQRHPFLIRSTYFKVKRRKTTETFRPTLVVNR